MPGSVVCFSLLALEITFGIYSFSGPSLKPDPTGSSLEDVNRREWGKTVKYSAEEVEAMKTVTTVFVGQSPPNLDESKHRYNYHFYWNRYVFPCLQ